MTKKLCKVETHLVIWFAAIAFLFITVGIGNIMYDELGIAGVAFVRGLTAFFMGLLGFMTVFILFGGK